uniref:Uncharacterized protein n=1 Tax=Oryza meridionalis TaxID=40149 RepID=A0A0E0CUV3_9ORYZ
MQVVNNSDEDYSHLPELDLSVMLNQGTLHQSQYQLLINHTSPVRKGPEGSFPKEGKGVRLTVVSGIIDVYGRED